jgi:membrane protease YdiL (CAAX protease family)
VLTYFALAFAISWGGVLLVIGGPGGIPASPEQAARLFPFAFVAMLPGPSVAGLLMTGLIHGRAGLRALLARLLRWRVGLRWYAVALLAGPLLAGGTLLALSLTSPVFLPGIVASDDKVSLLLIGLAVGLGAGIFEELGWTGFAVPGMRLRHGVLATGLSVGLLWGAWHYLVQFWGSGDATGAFSLPLFLVAVLFYIGPLPAYRVLMVWVYDRTQSLLVAMLMHASFTGGVLYVLMPVAIAELSLVTWYVVLAAVLWLLVAAVGVANHGQLARQPLVRQAGRTEVGAPPYVRPT